MGFVLVKFVRNESPSAVLRILDDLDCIISCGDYHDCRLKDVEQAGLDPVASAPAKSILRDKADNGAGERIELTLSEEHGCLIGSLRKTGILLSNRTINTDVLSSDPNVKSFLSRLMGQVEIASVEIS